MSMHRTPHRIVARIATAACALAMLGMFPVAASAQVADPRLQPTAFVHGFSSGGWTWAATADRLSRELAITPIVPTLNWRDEWLAQVGNLRAAMPTSHDRVITVGHSNGGQISRLYNMTALAHGAPLNDRMVFLTSLHRGAPLTDAALAGQPQNRFLWFGGYTFITLDFYIDMELRRYAGDVPATLIWGPAGFALGKLGNLGVWLPLRLEAMGFAEEAVAASVVRSAFDMSPTLSPWYRPDSPANLNSEVNLARELATAPLKFNIKGHYVDRSDWAQRPGNIFLATFFRENYEEWVLARALSYLAANSLWAHYTFNFDDPDPQFWALRDSAHRWMNIAGHLGSWDALWLDDIGALGAYDPGQMAWHWMPSDGILPDSVQVYAGPAIEFPLPYTHTNQTGNPDVANRLVDIFTGPFGVARKADLVGSVRIEPRSLIIATGSTASVAITVRNINGQVMSRSASLTSDAPTTASVSGLLVSGVAEGSTILRATVDGFTDAIPATVTAPAPISVASVTIGGPTSVPSTCSSASFSATLQPADASGPFTYQWSVNGVPVGGNEPWLAYDYANAGHTGSFTVAVAITQQPTGVVRSASLLVSRFTPTGPYPCE